MSAGAIMFGTPDCFEVDPDPRDKWSFKAQNYSLLGFQSWDDSVDPRTLAAAYLSNRRVPTKSSPLAYFQTFDEQSVFGQGEMTEGEHLAFTVGFKIVRDTRHGPGTILTVDVPAPPGVAGVDYFWALTKMEWLTGWPTYTIRTTMNLWNADGSFNSVYVQEFSATTGPMVDAAITATTLRFQWQAVTDWYGGFGFHGNTALPTPFLLTVMASLAAPGDVAAWVEGALADFLGMPWSVPGVMFPDFTTAVLVRAPSRGVQAGPRQTLTFRASADPVWAGEVSQASVQFIGYIFWTDVQYVSRKWKGGAVVETIRHNDPAAICENTTGGKDGIVLLPDGDETLRWTFGVV